MLQLPEYWTSREQLPRALQAVGPKGLLEKDILDIIAKAIATVLNDQEKQNEVKTDVKTDF